MQNYNIEDDQVRVNIIEFSTPAGKDVIGFDVVRTDGNGKVFSNLSKAKAIKLADALVKASGGKVFYGTPKRPFEPGDKVRILAKKKGWTSSPDIGDIGIVKESRMCGPDETLVSTDGTEEGWYYTPGEIEHVVDLAKADAAPKTYGEVVEIALQRAKAAADVLDPPNQPAWPDKMDQELATALRVMVGGILTRPNGEKALRALVGED